jgi:hypothetical protein
MSATEGSFDNLVPYSQKPFVKPISQLITSMSWQLGPDSFNYLAPAWTSQSSLQGDTSDNWGESPLY